jgi:glycosyltransferase involved in cell wall biosynthesis
MMPAILEKNTEAKLLIVGDGPELGNLTKKISELDLEDSVMITGQIEKRLLYTYLKITDVFVSLSVFGGDSYSLIEALCLGAPIIATDVGGNNEIIDNKINGLLIDDSDREGLVKAINKVLEDEDLASALTEKTKNKAEMFDQKRLVKQFINFILKVK